MCFSVKTVRSSASIATRCWPPKPAFTRARRDDAWRLAAASCAGTSLAASVLSKSKTTTRCGGPVGILDWRVSVGWVLVGRWWLMSLFDRSNRAHSQTATTFSSLCVRACGCSRATVEVVRSAHPIPHAACPHPPLPRHHTRPDRPRRARLQTLQFNTVPTGHYNSMPAHRRSR